MPPETDSIEAMRDNAVATMRTGTARDLLRLWASQGDEYPWNHRDPAVLFMALVRTEHIDLALAGRLADGLRVVVKSSRTL